MPSLVCARRTLAGEEETAAGIRHQYEGSRQTNEAKESVKEAGREGKGGVDGGRGRSEPGGRAELQVRATPAAFQDQRVERRGGGRGAASVAPLFVGIAMRDEQSAGAQLRNRAHGGW
jgi:hypothetical protein